MTFAEWLARTCPCPHPDPHGCAAVRDGRHRGAEPDPGLFHLNRLPDRDPDDRCDCGCHAGDEGEEEWSPGTTRKGVALSRTTIYLIPESGPAAEYAGFPNAFRSAWYVWTALIKRYLVRPGESPDVAAARVLFGQDDLPSLWGLADDPRLDGSERAVLRCTFDRAFCPAGRLRDMAHDLRAFAGRYPGFETLGEQAAALDRLADASPPGLLGVGWHQTSAAENLWRVYGPGEDECRPYDASVDSGLQSVYQDEGNP